MWDSWCTKLQWDRLSEFFGFLVKIIPPWLSIFMHHLGDE
jgi:hypothetical protein